MQFGDGCRSQIQKVGFTLAHCLLFFGVAIGKTTSLWKGAQQCIVLVSTLSGDCGKIRPQIFLIM